MASNGNPNEESMQVLAILVSELLLLLEGRKRAVSFQGKDLVLEWDDAHLCQHLF